MATQGRVITLNSLSYHMPPTCCSCGGPQQTQIDTSRSQKSGNVTTTLRMSFPYCHPCAGRARVFKVKFWAATAIPLALGAVIGGLAFLLPGLPIAVVGALALVVGLGGAIGAAIAIRPPAPPPPATARGEGMRILSFSSGSRVTLYCTNPTWGDAFAQANNVPAKPRDKGDGFLWGAIPAALLLVPAATAAGYFFAHPTVRVDNASPDALQIFVDGKPSITVGANSHTSMMVGHGNHTFGWAKAGATAPTGTTPATITVSNAYLYNPNKNACYWLVANVYGAASTAGLQSGPQRLQELYTFKKVDTWFGDNPQSVKVEKGASGSTRVALQRSKSCMDLVVHNCSQGIRETLVACQIAAQTDDALDTCASTAVQQCKTEQGIATPPAATAAPSAPPHAAKPTPGKVDPKAATPAAAKPAPAGKKK